jgi:hypothetical protein
MPQVTTEPQAIRPYLFHGVDLTYRDGATEAVGECPFCAKNKFYVSLETGEYQCKVCATGNKNGGGNAEIFLRKLHENSNGHGLPELAKHRRIDLATLHAWKVATSHTTRDPIVPGYYAFSRDIGQLYRYVKDRKTDKFKLLATPTMEQQLHGLNLFEDSKPIIYLCEGPWDAMALWEVLSKTKRLEGRLTGTSQMEHSLLAEANIIAVPGCYTFMEKWARLFSDKIVCLMYDNDYPKKNPQTGAVIESPGFFGMKRTAAILSSSNRPPAEIRYLNWGGAAGYNEEFPDGCDVRDFLQLGENKLAQLQLLLDRVEEVPKEWWNTVKRGKVVTKEKEPNEIQCKECKTYKELTTAWRKAMKWIDGLDHALAVMLASAISTRSIGDQLWIKVIGPAACGKSTLCEALSVNKNRVLAKSTIRGFHSGFKTSSNDAEDNSLISMLYNKTLVTKDGDTLLQSPNLGQILSEARDLYDSTSRTHYRNKASKDYQGVRMTWILCGTSSLRSIDASELGERFIDCVIMEAIDPDLEDEILIRKALRAERDVGIECNGDPRSQYGEELAEAMALTGGYLEYLCENTDLRLEDRSKIVSRAGYLLSKVVMPMDQIERCIRLGKFVAYMRARPSIKQEESAEREFGTRLVSQMVRLAKCLAVILNHSTVTDEVMARVTKVALDTARGTGMNIIRYLHKWGEDGAETDGIEIRCNLETTECRKMLRFMKQIGCLERFETTPPKRRIRWRLTKRIRSLYEMVTADALSGT